MPGGAEPVLEDRDRARQLLRVAAQVVGAGDTSAAAVVDASSANGGDTCGAGRVTSAGLALVPRHDRDRQISARIGRHTGRPTYDAASIRNR